MWRARTSPPPWPRKEPSYAAWQGEGGRVAADAAERLPAAGRLAATATTTCARPYDYRQGVSVWFRSLFTLDPDVSAMAHAPFVYQLHALPGMALFALWPFSRLVHAFAAPVGYLVRPYIVYRSRGPQRTARRPVAGHPVRAGAGRGREKDHSAARGR